MVQAFIFDFDGTLFDSTEANVWAYNEAFNKAGVEFDETKYRQAFGLRFNEMIGVVSPGLSEDKINEIRQAKVEFYAKAFDRVKPNIGLLGLAKALHEGYKTALVTTASLTNVNNLLNHFKIDSNLFNVIITGEHVERGKPDPECYLKAMEKLGLKPENCIIFEDSDVGLEAAKNARADVIKVSV